MPMILCSQMEDQGRARTGREPEGPRPWWVEKEQVHGPMCPSAGSLGFWAPTGGCSTPPSSHNNSWKLINAFIGRGHG